MAKGDDALRRKKNKVIRKRMRAGSDNSSKVSARVAAIIASKQRRKSGKRRMCEGMCFSLPTPDDPFNDKNDQKNLIKKNGQKHAAPELDVRALVTQKDARKDAFSRKKDPQTEKSLNVMHGKCKSSTSFSWKDQRNAIQTLETKAGMLEKGGVDNRPQHGIHGGSDGPSKFLTLCLHAIQKSLLDKNACNGNSEHPLLLNKWGAEFLACSLLGTDILETTGACSSLEQIAWMVSIAADVITMKEKEGHSVANPFLLILVPSKEKAIQVRTLCKPLKALGIHTVSLHNGASLDHQIQGLKSIEPEFLISTPERLLELVSLKAVDISGLSFLVVDGLEAFGKDGLLDQLKSIRLSIIRASLTVVFCDSFGSLSTKALQTLLDGPITRLSHTDSIASQSACIAHCVHMCDSQEKLSKGVKILKDECGKWPSSYCLNVLFIEETSSKAHVLGAHLVAEGYSIPQDEVSDGVNVVYSKETTVVTVTDLENAGSIDLEKFEVVLLASFPPEIDDYVKILTGMARHSVNGVLHSCFCQKDASLAGSLIEILEQCQQNVPEFLRSYHASVTMSGH